MDEKVMLLVNDWILKNSTNIVKNFIMEEVLTEVYHDLDIFLEFSIFQSTSQTLVRYNLLSFLFNYQIFTTTWTLHGLVILSYLDLRMIVSEIFIFLYSEVYSAISAWSWLNKFQLVGLVFIHQVSI